MNEGGNIKDSNKYVIPSLSAGSMPRIDVAKTRGYEGEEWGIMSHYFVFTCCYSSNFI